VNYYERHIGDYLKDTAHLSLLEHGIYSRLLDIYYSREAPLPADQVMRLVGARSDEEKSAARDVLNEFFVFDGDVYRHNRCDRELEKYQDKARKASASAAARWNKPAAQCDGDANAMRTHSERNAEAMLPVTSNQTPVRERVATQLPALRAEERPTSSVSEIKKSKTPTLDCPHAEVLALWAEVLPQLPQHLASQWRGARAAHLKARWRETAAEKGWVSQTDGLDYLRRLFGFVGRSPFLCGRAPPIGSRPPFVAELAWLVEPGNWAKVLEGKYHQEAA
jgi:uncharacterized protein YdaU (DUF1376 family)